MTRAAAIDAGSNTILLLAGESIPGGAPGSYRVLRDEIEFARLGEGIDSRRLSAAAMERGLSAFRRYASICIDLGVTHVKATGTSALRDAENGADFLEAVRRETGYAIEIIGGEREARLGFASATDDLPAETPAVVLDIGGGSMQLITGVARGAVSAAVSLDLGAVRLTERWLPFDPPSPAQLERLAAGVRAELAEKAPRAPAEEAFDVIGVSGTCTTLAAVSLKMERYDGERIHGAILPMAEIDRLQTEFLATDSAGRARMPGLHPKRADVIVAGVAVLREVLRHYRRERLVVADRGIRHAVLREALASLASR